MHHLGAQEAGVNDRERENEHGREEDDVHQHHAHPDRDQRGCVVQASLPDPVRFAPSVPQLIGDDQPPGQKGDHQSADEQQARAGQRVSHGCQSPVEDAEGARCDGHRNAPGHGGQQPAGPVTAQHPSQHPRR
eukprot:Nk52_evm1s1965 gene=Nk52_evmTU1s1965